MARGIAAEPRTYAVAIGASAVFGVVSVAVSQVLGAVTDRVVVPAIEGSQSARDLVPVAGAVLLALAIALGVSVALRKTFAGIGSSRLQARHRTRVTRQYLTLPLSWHRRHPTGQLLSNASSDVEAATSVFNALPYALGVVVMVVVAAVALVATDPWLGLAALSIVPLAVVANVVFQRAMSPAARRAQRLRAEVADLAHESFEAAVLVKSLGTEEHQLRRFSGRTQQLREANVRVGVVRALFDPVMDLLPSIGTVLVLLIGTVRVRAGAVATGDVVAAGFLLALLAVPVRAIGWVLAEVPRSLVGHDRIARVVDARSDLVPGTRRLPLPAGPWTGARVTLRGVRVDAPDQSDLPPLLTDVDLDLLPGRTVALVGPTGAGKSTLVSLLGRLQDPTAGTVLLDGTDVREVAAKDLARHVALVLQQGFLFEDTVRANVTLTDPGADSSDDEVWQALRLARVEGVVAALPGGLDAPLGERAANLSGGQRQRLAIARALLRRPRLLVLDDATSAVDPATEHAVLEGLRSDQGAGPTVVLVAYRMSSVLLADEVVHLDGGRVVDRGTHAELLARDAGYRQIATAYELESLRRAEEDGAPALGTPPAHRLHDGSAPGAGSGAGAGTGAGSGTGAGTGAGTGTGAGAGSVAGAGTRAARRGTAAAEALTVRDDR
jgi:ATP-binding cassette subfamily B protein